MPATATRLRTQILEQGNILFLYRPREGVAHPQGAGDLERAYFMLLPDDREEHKNRIFAVPGGLFPVIVPGAARPEEHTWALVQEVDPDPRAALSRLQEERPRRWVRAAGEGRYVIARHEDHTHLAYVLARPAAPGEVQQALRLAPEGNYLISVQDPAAPAEIAPDQRPIYPPRLQDRFRGDDSIPVEPTGFLDYPHTRVFLLAATASVEQGLGIRLQADVLNIAQRQAFQVLHKEEREAAHEGVALLQPLKEGHWE